MPTIVTLVLTGLIIVAGVVVGRLGAAWWKYRGKRVISCPENHEAAGVTLDTKYAAVTALRGDVKLRLSQCSRWPEKQDCGQDCLFQIERSPEDCLVRNILVHWYQGKNCVWCGRPIGDIHAAGRKPALLSADRGSVEWQQVPADQLPKTLAAAQPLCFGCHVANTMAREHPELVIQGSRPVLAGTSAEKK
jgi:hypothetical protein